MKKLNIWTRTLTLVLTVAMLMGVSIPVGVHAQTTSTVADEVQAQAASDDGDLRVIITSDIHHTDLEQAKWYGDSVTTDQRMQLWVDSIKYEHSQSPIDLIIIAGDTSNDYQEDFGTMTKGISNTQDLINEYVSQLPKDIPVYILPGNHEQYSNEQWKAMTGNDRQFSVEMEGNLFICLDNFNDNLEPDRETDPAYTASDINFVKQEMAKYPYDKVWLIGHWIGPVAGVDVNFREFVKNEDRIIGLFAGHGHECDSVPYVNKILAKTGHFSYSYYDAYPTGNDFEQDVKNVTDCFWGFRELVISEDSAYSNYILADTGDLAPKYRESYATYTATITNKRRIIHTVTYEDIAVVAPTENWGPAADGVYYINTPEDMLAFNVLAQTETFNGKTVRLSADIDMSNANWISVRNSSGFRGTFDGGGHTISNFSTSRDSDSAMFWIIRGGAKIKDVSFVGGTVRSAGDNVATLAVMAADTVTFENVYIKNTLEGTNYVAGFVATVQGTGRNIYFRNCVSEATIDVTGSGIGGFVGRPHPNNYLEFTDCAFIGTIENVVEGAGGFIGYLIANVKLERCVSLGAIEQTTTDGYEDRWSAFVHLDHRNVMGTAYSNIEMIDCYSATAKATDGEVRAVSAASSRGYGYNITVKYGDEVVYTWSDKTAGATSSATGIYSKISDINAAFKYLAKGDQMIINTETFTGSYPVLAQNGWIMTDENINYDYADTSLTVPKLLPKVIADRLGIDTFASPVDATYWHVNDNGDNTYDVRFIGTVSVKDVTEYASVGVKMTVILKGESDVTLVNGKSYATKKVFKSFELGNNVIQAEDGDFLFAVDMRGFRADDVYEIKFIAFMIDDDTNNTVIYDYEGESVITVSNGAVV